MTSMGLVTSSLRHRAVRGGIAALSVAIATAVAVLVQGSLQPIDAFFKLISDTPALFVHSRYGGKLPFSAAKRISELTGIDPIHYFYWIDGRYRDTERFRVAGLDSGQLSHLQQADAPGYITTDPQELAAFESNRQGMLPTELVMKELGLKKGDTFTFKTSYGDLTGQVMGTWRGAWGDGDRFLAVHYDYLTEALPALRGYVQSIAFYAKGDAQAQGELARKIDDEFAHSPDPTLTVTREAWTSVLWARPARAIPEMLWKISLLMLAVTALVTSSTLIMSLRERRAEFGTLRALGFSRGRVSMLVFAEAFAICLLGGVLGAGIPLLLLRKSIPLGDLFGSPFTIQVDPISAAKGLAIAAIVAIVSGLWPAIETARLDVVKVLGKA